MTKVVSHRWEQEDEPDPRGEQQRVLKEFLTVNEDIEGVWYDYWCTPQGDYRTPKQTDFFKYTLRNINMPCP